MEFLLAKQVRTRSRESTHVLARAGGHEAGEETTGRNRLAGVAEVALNYAVVKRMEVKLEGVVLRGSHRVGGEGQGAVLSDIDTDGGS